MPVALVNCPQVALKTHHETVKNRVGIVDQQGAASLCRYTSSVTNTTFCKTYRKRADRIPPSPQCQQRVREPVGCFVHLGFKLQKMVTELVSRHMMVTCYQLLSDLSTTCESRFCPKKHVVTYCPTCICAPICAFINCRSQVRILVVRSSRGTVPERTSPHPL